MDTKEILRTLSDFVVHLEEIQVDLENDDIKSGCFRLGCAVQHINQMIHIIEDKDKENGQENQKDTERE